MDMADKRDEADKLLDEMIKGRTPAELTGEGGLLQELTKRFYERALEGEIRDNLIIEAGSAKPFEVKKWDMESFKAVDKAGNIDFSDGYDQSKAFSNSC